MDTRRVTKLGITAGRLHSGGGGLWNGLPVLGDKKIERILNRTRACRLQKRLEAGLPSGRSEKMTERV
jgi:hypothetical protein